MHTDEWDPLYQTAPVGLAFLDAELRFIRVNEHLAAINGRSVSDHLGARLSDIVPGIAAIIEPLYREVIATGKPILKHELRGAAPTDPDMERRWLLSLHPLKTDDGCCGVSCAVQDITELRQTQHMLSLTQYSIENASDEIMWLDESGRFVYVNQAACDRLGHTREELERMKVGDVVPNHPPERYPQVWSQIHKQDSLSFESAHRAKDGRIIPVGVALNLVRFQGEEYCFAVVRDITERKNEEAQQQRLARRVQTMQSMLVAIATDQELWDGGVAQAVRHVTEVVAGTLEVARVGVWLFGQEEGTLRSVDIFDRAANRHEAGQVVLCEGHAVSEPGALAVPIRVAGRVAGILAVEETGRRREWIPEETSFVTGVADQVANAMLNAERRQTEQVIQRLAGSVLSKTGHDFFRSTVASLAEVLQADWAFIGELVPPGHERVRTLAMWSDGREAAPMEYDLAGTPCASVMKSAMCSYPNGLQQRFPRDPMLAEIGVEGYVGAPLFSSTGRPLGILAVMYRQPIEQLVLVETGLAAFAARAAAELERLQNEEALRKSEQRYKALVANTTENIWCLEFEPPVPTDLPDEELVRRMLASGYCADCNDATARMRGLQRAEDMIGMRLSEVMQLDVQGDAAVRKFVENRFRMHSEVFAVKDFSGNQLHVLRTGFGVVEEGLLRRVWGSARNITELKRAEEEIRRLNAGLEDRLRQNMLAYEEIAELKSRLERENAYLLEEIKTEHNFDEMVGESPAFMALTETIRRAAPTSAPVLILGETGTGKELIARALHNLSPRRGRTLVKVNCAAISAGLVESELFGHVKGAFTGAVERRIGRFEFAHGGTLFLDEVGELPPEMQVKLLRVLQEQEFEPVGSNRTVRVDTRVIAATNRRLEDAVREGRFRSDLFYRLNVVPVEVPPLRERKEDIPLLVSVFLAAFSRKFGRRVETVSQEAMTRLKEYSWPGNIRELENLLARAVVLAGSPVLSADSLALPADSRTPAARPAPPVDSTSLEGAERRHILGVLANTRWVIEGAHGAAGLLHLHPNTLRSRMKKLGIRRPSPEENHLSRR